MARPALFPQVDRFDLPMILSPSQSIVLRDILPRDRHAVEAVLTAHGVRPLYEVGRPR
jgi:sulfite reductase (ferredoxin)